MDDRELLELAAKAAGLTIVATPVWAGALTLADGQPWRPHTDDGDAFRLGVKTGVLWEPDFWHQLSCCYFSASLGGDRQDPCAATRRAILRAAAEIGKALP